VVLRFELMGSNSVEGTRDIVRCNKINLQIYELAHFTNHAE
jgi:hypothetical protein